MAFDINLSMIEFQRLVDFIARADPCLSKYGADRGARAEAVLRRLSDSTEMKRIAAALNAIDARHAVATEKHYAAIREAGKQRQDAEAALLSTLKP